MDQECSEEVIAVYSVCKAAIAVVAAYDGVEAPVAVCRLAALAPSHVKLVGRMAEDAVLKTINQSDTSYNGLACYALIRLVAVMELDLLRRTH